MILVAARLVALLSVGVQVGVSYSHALQAPGKRTLTADVFLRVQTDLLNYQPGLGPVEAVAFLSVLVVLLLVRRRRSVFLLTLGGLACLAAMWGVWALFIEPINVQIDGQTLASIPADWESLRDRWHAFHLFRLALAVVGMSALILSVLVETPTGGARKRLGY
jgi:hypothetical protein